jgi:hypothetical protein
MIALPVPGDQDGSRLVAPGINRVAPQRAAQTSNVCGALADF